jgi:hypothetical protein
MYLPFRKLLPFCGVFLLFCKGTVFSEGKPLNQVHLDFSGSIYSMKEPYLDRCTIIAGGIQCDFPVGMDHLTLRFGADIGKVLKTDHTDATGILLSNISLVYSIPLYHKAIFIHPALSLLNCALHAQPSGDVRDAIIIATWENEFGAGMGVQVTYVFKRISISVPCMVGVIFSSDPALLLGSGLKIGMDIIFPRKMGDS